MNVDYIPVIVERAFRHGFPCMPHFKLRAPGSITMFQFLDKIRARLKLPSQQAVHFVLEKGLPVGMSQTLKNVYEKSESEEGLLRLTCVSENTFGCIPSYEEPIESRFPGVEALPFGAPEPTMFFPGGSLLQQDEEEIQNAMFEAHNMMTEYLQHGTNQAHLTELEASIAAFQVAVAGTSFVDVPPPASMMFPQPSFTGVPTTASVMYPQASFTGVPATTSFTGVPATTSFTGVPTTASMMYPQAPFTGVPATTSLLYPQTSFMDVVGAIGEASNMAGDAGFVMVAENFTIEAEYQNPLYEIPPGLLEQIPQPQSLADESITMAHWSSDDEP